VTLTVTDNANATGQTSHAVTVNAPPVASFTSACSGLTCSFNASGSSDSDGTIASYAWTFGDGATGSGATASRTYAAGGTYSVALTVTDNAGATSQTSHAVTVNAPPVASFTSACSGLTCSFNASGSSDPDGTITGYAWTFGDGATGSGATASRTYAAGGTYSVQLTVTDNGSATGTQVQSVTVVPPPTMHVGDLDRASTLQQNSWTATVTITVHTSSHGPLANAAVSGAWNNGARGFVHHERQRPVRRGQIRNPQEHGRRESQRHERDAGNVRVPAGKQSRPGRREQRNHHHRRQALGWAAKTGSRRHLK
jgi:PKD repeat protein